jgi:hypothetical protein
MLKRGHVLKQWRIKDGSAFLLRCVFHVPALSGALFAFGYCVTFYLLGYPTYGIEQLPMMLCLGLLLMIPGAIAGVIIGAVPGVIGGAVLLFLSRFRAPTTFEFVAVAAIAAGLLGHLLEAGSAGYSVWYLPYAVACTGALCALAVAPSVRERGIIVPYNATTKGAPLPVER